MDWIHDYQLFLFDLDGLLVNTEEIHFKAYQQMCSKRGYRLPWDFQEYCLAAHYDSTMLQKRIYESLPQLKLEEPDWAVLYAEKKQAMLDLLQDGAVHMMPGAEALLSALDSAQIKRCVVTHSPNEQIELIRDKNPILNTIKHWYTRETYTEPKPHPECYLNAIQILGEEGDKIIGFEDTPRGLNALMHTSAKPNLVTKINYPELKAFKSQGVTISSQLG